MLMMRKMNPKLNIVKALKVESLYAIRILNHTVWGWAWKPTQVMRSTAFWTKWTVTVKKIHDMLPIALNKKIGILDGIMSDHDKPWRKICAISGS